MESWVFFCAWNYLYGRPEGEKTSQNRHGSPKLRSKGHEFVSHYYIVIFVTKIFYTHQRMSLVDINRLACGAWRPLPAIVWQPADLGLQAFCRQEIFCRSFSINGSSESFRTFRWFIVLCLECALPTVWSKSRRVRSPPAPIICRLPRNFPVCVRRQGTCTDVSA